MRHKRLKISAIFLFGLSLTGIQAQESFNATGGNASDGGVMVSYSIGQVACQINTGIGGTVAEGVQQPFDIYAVTGLEETKSIIFSIAVYPNPTTYYLILDIKNYVQTSHGLSQLSFQLYDLQGKLLQTQKLTDNETEIDMSNYIPATYFVKIVKTSHDLSRQEVKTFKIIKK